MGIRDWFRASGGSPSWLAAPEPVPAPAPSPWLGPQLYRTDKTGNLDEMLVIRATSGMVEIVIEDDDGSSVILKVKPDVIPYLTERLRSAADAAALMASTKEGGQ